MSGDKTISVSVAQQRKNAAAVSERGASSSLQFDIGDGSANIPVGKAGDIIVPFGAIVKGFTLIESGFNTCSIDIDVRKSNYELYPGDVSMSPAADRPKIVDGFKSKSDNVASWDTQIENGDVLSVHIMSNTGAKKVSLSIHITK